LLQISFPGFGRKDGGRHSECHQASLGKELLPGGSLNKLRATRSDAARLSHGIAAVDISREVDPRHSQ
jgi:hypothetical protein